MPTYADLFRSQRYVPAENDSGERIPAHALVRVTGWDGGLFLAAKPDADGQAVWAAGPLPTADGETVPLTNDWPAWVLYDSGDGTPAVGETWGAGAASWKLRKNEAGFVIVGDPDAALGIVPVDLPRAAAAARSPSAAVLTEATGAASGKVRQLNGSFAWTDGSTLTNVIYPVEIGGSAFTPAATSNGLLWEDPAQAGKYDFLPVQWASSAVGGYVSTGTQTLAGAKTFSSHVTIDTGTATISSGGVATSGGRIGWHIYFLGTNNGFMLLDEYGDLMLEGGGVSGKGTVYASYYDGGMTPQGGFGLYNYSGTTKIQGGTEATGGLTFKGGLYVSGTVPPIPSVPPGVATGTDPDSGVFNAGYCTTISTLSGVNTTWTVAVGDVVVVTNGRIQSITPAGS